MERQALDVVKDNELFSKTNVVDKIEDLTHRIFERIELSCTQAKAVNTMN